MYPYWSYGLYTRPSNPYLAALCAEKEAETTNLQNVILSRQVVDLTKENINLRNKIRQLHSQDNTNKNQQNKTHKQVQTSKKSQRKEQQQGCYKTQAKRYQLNNTYSFGNLRKNPHPPPIQRSQQQKPSPEKLSNRKEIEGKIYKRSDNNKNYKNDRSTSPLNQNYNQKQSTFIERLHQSKLNPENVNSSSYVGKLYNQSYRYKTETSSIMQQNQQHPFHSQKTNKIYLLDDGRILQSPASKLKSIKKINQSQINEIFRGTNRKQYLQIVGKIISEEKHQDNDSDKK